VGKKLRVYFFSGLLVLAPLVVTLYVVWKLFIGIDGLLNRYVTKAIITILGLQIKLQSIPGLGIIALLVLILGTGFIAKHYLGRRLLKTSDDFLHRIPVINLIYTTIQQISEAFLTSQNNIFKRAALIEFPQKGSFAIGFITQEIKGPIQQAVAPEVYGIFLPTAPNPTSGFLLFIPKKDVRILDVSIEYALKLVISGGTINPAADGKNEFKFSDSSNVSTPLPIVNSPSQTK
jgi:uncharacterized membrane protein